MIPNCQIELTFSVQPNSGGHDHHDDSRPQGTLEPISGSTGDTGFAFTTVYTAREVAGVTEVGVTGRTPSGGSIFGGFTIGVRVAGLEELAEGENYDLVGSFGEPGVTSQHIGNHYGTPALNAMLVRLADDHAAAFPGEVLQYNDMSLVGGGLFDLGNNWVRPHRDHRFGRNLDLRTIVIPAQNRRALRQLILDGGFRLLEELNPPHWHLTGG